MLKLKTACDEYGYYQSQCYFYVLLLLLFRAYIKWHDCSLLLEVSPGVAKCWQNEHGQELLNHNILC